MEISHQIVKPLLRRLLQEYSKLQQEVYRHACASHDFQELKIQIEDKLNQLKIMNMLGGFHTLHAGPLNVEGQERLRENVRHLKLEVRFLSRRWKRHLISENRLRRQREKGNYVSAVAA